MSDQDKVSLEDQQKLARASADLLISTTIQALNAAGFTDEAIASELAAVGFSDIKDFVKDGKMVDLDKLGKASKAIQKIKLRSVTTATGQTITRVDLELHSKLDAIGKVIAMKGLNKPVKVELGDGKASEDPEIRDAANKLISERYNKE